MSSIVEFLDRFYGLCTCGPHEDSGRSLEVYGDIHPREMVVHDRTRLITSPIILNPGVKTVARGNNLFFTTGILWVLLKSIIGFS
jgi:hypothetical protein